MASIHIDDKTAQKLQALATTMGLSIEEYLAHLATHLRANELPPLSEAEFDAQLDALTHHGPSLPPDFSRADIYADHD